MTRRRFAAGIVCAALLVAPLTPAFADEVTPVPVDPAASAPVEPEIPTTEPEIPTTGPEIPTTETPPETVSAVVRTADGTVAVTTAPDADALAVATADDTVLAVDNTARRYAMALPADDAGRDLQWSLSRLQAEDLWQRSTGAGTTVAVLDTGVKASHPDLRGKVARGYNAITGKPGARRDDNGHGTILAGIIAGRINGSGIAGLAPNARILPVKVLDADGVGDSDDIARGIIWAVDNGADVINMSFGADASNRVEAEAIDYARGAGVTLIAAGGNEGARLVMYPAGYPGVLGVGAVDFNDKRASFSNQGSHIDVVAPGQGILSSFATRPYTWTSGTSMATAYVSAVAALAMSYSPGAGGEPLLQQIMATARDIGATGRDPETGAGIVDPAALLEQQGGGRAPGMPRDMTASGTPDGTLHLTFTPPAGATYAVQFKKGKKAPAGPGSGTRVGEGTGAWQPVSLDVPGKNPKTRYAFAVFTQGPSGTSRAIATVRPLKWTMTGSRSVPRDSRQRLQVGLRLPTFGYIGGWPLQVTSQRGGLPERVRRFIPSSDGPDTFTVRDMRWSFHYRYTLQAPGFWNASSPQESQWVDTTVTAQRNGRITGRVTPNRSASEVQLQRKAGKAWKTIDTTNTNRGGRFSFPGKKGNLRVFAPADLWHGPAAREL
ncbi:MAG TPA: S8 family serine peptidase [Actinomycetota bacterium]|nr:S8 family serine peptidase [Actinomycetota bacterium]